MQPGGARKDCCVSIQRRQVARRPNPFTRFIFRDQRGAIMVEFLIAFLPLFVFFECIIQLTGLTVAKMVIQHSAYVAARAAVVVLPDDPKYYGGTQLGVFDGQRRDEIQRAAAIPLTAVRSLVHARVSVQQTASRRGNATGFTGQRISVRVQADYRCFVPLASIIVCGSSSGERTLTAEASLPYQGAPYPY